MTAEAHTTVEVSAALEKAGASLERLMRSEKGWDLGSVDRERGYIEATCRAGLLPGVAHVVFELQSTPTSGTSVVARLVGTPLLGGRSSLRKVHALLSRLGEHLEDA